MRPAFACALGACLVVALLTVATAGPTPTQCSKCGKLNGSPCPVGTPTTCNSVCDPNIIRPYVTSGSNPKCASCTSTKGDLCYVAGDQYGRGAKCGAAASVCLSSECRPPVCNANGVGCSLGADNGSCPSVGCQPGICYADGSCGLGFNNTACPSNGCRPGICTGPDGKCDFGLDNSACSSLGCRPGICKEDGQCDRGFNDYACPALGCRPGLCQENGSCGYGEGTCPSVGTCAGLCQENGDCGFVAPDPPAVPAGAVSAGLDGDTTVNPCDYVCPAGEVMTGITIRTGCSTDAIVSITCGDAGEQVPVNVGNPNGGVEETISFASGLTEVTRRVYPYCGNFALQYGASDIFHMAACPFCDPNDDYYNEELIVQCQDGMKAIGVQATETNANYWPYRKLVSTFDVICAEV